MVALTSGKSAKRSMSAMRRRASYDQRMAAAPSDRERRHALVWWWLSELRQLPAEHQAIEVARLERIATALNEGRTGDD